MPLLFSLSAFPKGSSLETADGMFKLEWKYKNGKMIFNMRCKTMGWCAVDCTTTGDGKNMVNYDIAIGGVASAYFPFVNGRCH